MVAAAILSAHRLVAPLPGVRYPQAVRKAAVTIVSDGIQDHAALANLLLAELRRHGKADAAMFALFELDKGYTIGNDRMQFRSLGIGLNAIIEVPDDIRKINGTWTNSKKWPNTKYAKTT
jgi:hypothetical protein